jgi:hypothetical protein
MSVRQFAAKMRQDIEAVKAQGTAAIFVDRLIAYLSSVENSPEPTTSQIGQSTFDPQAEAYRHQSAASLENFRSVILAGQNAIRTMVLVNGGASVALLAFLGHMLGRGEAAASGFAEGLLFFVSWTLFAGLVSGFTYLSQRLYGGAKGWHQTAGDWASYLAIGLGFASYIAFGCGAWWTYSTFDTLPTP